MSKEAWDELNDRQRAYLAAAYRAEQAVEADRAKRGAAGIWDAMPASVWRWLLYGPTTPASPLYCALRDAGLLDAGTGSTWKALEDRGLILTQDRAFDVLFVQVTRRGRAVARAGLGEEAPKRKPKGELRIRQWAALVDLARAGVAGLVVADYEHGLGQYDWMQTLLRLRNDGLMEAFNPTGHERGWRYRITAVGMDHYRERWSIYQEQYPEVGGGELPSEEGEA